MTAFRLVATSSARPPFERGPNPQLPVPIDLVVDGMNLTARLEAADPRPLLGGLAQAIALLAGGVRTRASVPCLGHDATWEIELERDGKWVLFSLFRGGRRPEVAVFERSIGGRELIAALGHALDTALAARPARSEDIAANDLAAARAALAEITWGGGARTSSAAVLAVEPENNGPVRFSTDLVLRDRPEEPRAAGALRADLFSLLGRGSLRVTCGSSTRELTEAFVFPVAEMLVELAAQALEADLSGYVLNRRTEACGIVAGVRLVPAGSSGLAAQAGAWLTLGRRDGSPRPWTFPIAGARALAEGVVAFGRALARTLVRQYPSHRYNLRLIAFREAVRELAEQLRELTREDAKVNPTPDAYRIAAPKSDAPDDTGAPPARIRYGQKWTATIPGLDLRSTFLCGDRMIVGTARETACLDRSSGALLWQHATPPALSVVTPAGLARIQADGTLSVLDFGTGETTLVARLAPRSGASAAGAVVNMPGLPRLLITTEGERHLSALDLRTGEVRWRHAARRGEIFRIRRAGKLLIVAAGDCTLSALDVLSGEVVWRVRARLRFCQHPGLDHDSLFAVAGETAGPPRGRLELHHLDPYAGRTRWARDLRVEDGVPCQAPLVTSGTVALMTRDRRGLGIAAYDRSTGERLWSKEPGFAAPGSAALAVDDLLLINTDGGELFAIAARTGECLYRQAFARGLDGDQPRRLEPVLRSGALFVPQQTVHVVRPRDGALLGRIDTDIIPDLLRVDERCDVYVAEESGHVASFRAGPRLSLV